MQTFRSLEELDRKLAECRLASVSSDDELRALFQGFQGQFVLDHPADPFSDEYRVFQMALYERFAGRPYRLANESTPVDIESSVTRPFPFHTGSAVTAGQHMGAIAFLLRCLRLPPGARILEFGPGWGNTTIALAQLGFQVTAVDVDPGFCDLLRRRSRQQGVGIAVVQADFFWAETISEPFDAVLFFECFHHCDDHLRLLRALHGAAGPSGRVYFGAEPILADYPVPWGLRMDGEALWAIRHHGWLELGFRESYFREALRRTGWTARHMVSADLPWIGVWEAERLADGPLVIEASDPRMGTLVGRRGGGGIVVEAGPGGYGCYGPYVPLPAGRYRATLQFDPAAALHGSFHMDACAERGLAVFAGLDIDAGSIRANGTAQLAFATAGARDDVEIRLFARAGAAATILRLAIEPFAGDSLPH